MGKDTAQKQLEEYDDVFIDIFDHDGKSRQRFEMSIQAAGDAVGRYWGSVLWIFWMAFQPIAGI